MPSSPLALRGEALDLSLADHAIFVLCNSQDVAGVPDVLDPADVSRCRRRRRLDGIELSRVVLQRSARLGAVLLDLVGFEEQHELVTDRR